MMSAANPTLVLFRHDLRLGDNLALVAAAGRGGPVIPVFVFDEESPGVRPIGGARRWWLHHSLTALAADLAKRGSRLVVRRGVMADVAKALAHETGAAAVFWNRRYDPAGRNADAAMKTALKAAGLAAESFDGFLLHEPWRLLTGGGTPFKVFTPFWRALQASGPPRDPVDAPSMLPAPDTWPDSLAVDDLGLTPRRPDWSTGLAETWIPGEAAANDRLELFLAEILDGYAERRDRPDIDATSRLSPHLAHGEISPRRIRHAAMNVKASGRDRDKFLAELAWREFSWHLLFHRPDLPVANCNPAFDAFAWVEDREGFRAWRKGKTGYPMVDAGMRQLWSTGWMHNRVRMVAASFLVKHLLTDWRKGEAWFWDTLVDADMASNAASWQWVAGSGADAAPWFRIFNPVLQGEKFDKDGDYVRANLPELADEPGPSVHRAANAKRGSYPAAIIGHDFARARALAALETMRLAKG